MFEFFIVNKEFLIFVLLLSVFLLIKRKNLEVQGSFPIFYVLMYKTKLGLEKMDRWSSGRPKVFLYLSYLSIFVGVVGLFLSLVFMFWQLIFIIENDIKQGGGLVLPIKTSSGTIGGIPVVAPPFFEWLVALMILVIVHEFAHGVIAERFKIRIKSSGFAFMGLILPLLPAAFVEPDEKDLKKADKWKQIAVFGAGSTSNFIFGVLFYLVFAFLAVPLVNNTQEVTSISFSSVMNESSFKDYGVESGELLKLNGKDISEFEFILANGAGPGMSDIVVLPEFFNFSVNESLVFTVRTGDGISDYEIVTFQKEEYGERGMIGISGFEPKIEPATEFSYLGGFPIFFQRLIFWIVLLNIGIGIMNLLPLWITDGGQIAKALLEKCFRDKKKVMFYLNLVSYVSLLTIIFLLWPGLLKSFVSLF